MLATRHQRHVKPKKKKKNVDCFAKPTKKTLEGEKKRKTKILL